MAWPGLRSALNSGAPGSLISCRRMLSQARAAPCNSSGSSRRCSFRWVFGRSSVRIPASRSSEESLSRAISPTRRPSRNASRMSRRSRVPTRSGRTALREWLEVGQVKAIAAARLGGAFAFVLLQVVDATRGLFGGLAQFGQGGNHWYRLDDGQRLVIWFILAGCHRGSSMHSGQDGRVCLSDLCVKSDNFIFFSIPECFPEVKPIIPFPLCTGYNPESTGPLLMFP